MNLNSIIKSLCPPILISVLRRIKKSTLISVLRKIKKSTIIRKGTTTSQDLDMYWDPNFAEVLETWGEGNAWNEIQLLMAGRKGKVLDIACGTGKTISILLKFEELDLFGCDISEMLLSKASEKHNIPMNKLRACDATKLPYADNEFNYAFSIGSIEHFTEEGIVKFLSECYRTVSHISFHQHPVSRSGQNEGWITSTQSYHNNSIEWWKEKYDEVYDSVYVLDSVWEDGISLGRWFICEKKNN
jgi:SAM-dependent methyltransferase|tara:strand:- start:3212 stop:3943 length:732 start_codon:yes stop_codon:yes gene_type:complete